MIYETMRVPSRDRGGALPVYQRQVAGHAPGSAVSARVDDSAARIVAAGADAQTKAAAGLGKAVTGAVETEIRAYDDYSKSKATQLITQYRRDMNQALYGEGGILTRQGEDALDADGQRAARASQLRGELLRGATDATRHYFTLLADDFDADSSLKAQKYAGEQRLVMLNRNDEAASQERAEWAMTSYARQADFDRGLGEGLWHAEQLLRRKGYSGEALRHGLRNFSGRVFAGALQQALAGGDVRAAERLLAQGSAARKGAEGEAGWPRMSAKDIADAKVRIQSKKDALEAKAEAQRKKAEAAADEARVEQGYQDVMSGVSEFPSTWSADERMAKVVELTADMEPDLRSAVRKRARADIDERELMRKAGLTQELGMVDRMLEANPQYTSNEKIRLIQESGISDEAKAAAVKELETQREGKGNAEASSAGLRAYRAFFDERFGTLSETEKQALVYELNLNAADRKAALEYGGRGLEYSQTRIDKLIDNVLGKDVANGTEKNRLYAALMTMIPAGESWDEKRIKEAIGLLWNGQESGAWYTRSQRLYTRVLDGTDGQFRPDIPEAMRASLNRELEGEYPFFTSAPERVRELMRQAVWLRRQYGIAPEWTDEELKLLQGAGVR
ncbi:MAG: hypothetical protein J1E80_09980 [Desulfovibrionaceae bacterium]|nr:hypothetical protein [Desulfovibrionaceae bacterium]